MEGSFGVRAGRGALDAPAGLAESAGYSHAAEPAGEGEREERRVMAMCHVPEDAGRRAVAQALDFNRA
jgi:hypothetical protein